jgi:protein-S-isoprenylcysteine O-methyltransferase Ste14
MTTTHSAFTRSLGFGYAMAACLGFLASFGYFILRTMGYVERWDIGAGVSLPPWGALAFNALLVAGFVVQHSIMARTSFKQRLAYVLPPALERATFVWAANVALALASYFWATSPSEAWNVWSVETPLLGWALWTLGLLGWLGVAGASLFIDHFELFGLRQAYTWATKREFKAKDFRTPGAYRIVRHPMMLSMLVGLWACESMNGVRLTLASFMTAYVFFGMRLEERDLLVTFGAQYRDYQRRVPKILPGLKPLQASDGDTPASFRAKVET